MDYKKLVLFIIFIVSLLFLYQNWQLMAHPEGPVLVQSSPSSAISSAATSVPVAASGYVSVQPLAKIASPRPPVHDADLIWVDTDVLRVGLNPQGGTIERLYLQRVYQSLKDKKPVVLFNNDGSAHFYVAESGLASVAGVTYPNHETHYQVSPGPYVLQPGQDTIRVVLVGSDHGVRLTKTYVFHRGAYQIQLDQEVENRSGKTFAPTAYFQLLRDNTVPPSVSKFVNTFTGPAVYTAEDKFHKLSFSDLNELSAPFSAHTIFGWASFIQHYFVGAWIPDQSSSVLTLYADRIAPGIYRVGFQQSLPAIKNGGTTHIHTILFAGPQREILLNQVHDSFDLVRDYGWLTFISRPLFAILNFFDSWVGNWGWSIVLLTLLVKLIFFPLSAASYRSMAKMKVLGPAMQLLRERYAEDKQKQQQEMMALFKKEKVNPMLGCLPMLVQIPVFIALYYVLVESAELRQAPWIFWIQDLSVKDPFYILPIILAVTTFIQVRLNPSAGDPAQARMMMIMPMIFSIMFFFFPSGLVLYWFVSNLFSLVQQWYMTRSVAASPVQRK